MAKSILYTCTYQDVEYTDNLAQWSRRVDKSTTFLRDMMSEAEDKGLTGDAKMQYAIEQIPGQRNNKNPDHRVNKNNDYKLYKENKFREKQQSLINMFNLGKALCVYLTIDPQWIDITASLLAL